MLYTKRAYHIFVMMPINLAGMILIICIAFAASCSKDNEPAPDEKKPSIQLAASVTLGSYLVDSLGNTLYFFSNDFDGQSNCTGGCLALWPIYYAGDHLTQASLGAGLDMDDFATIITPGGKQTTYKSWPLYYYAPAEGGYNVREAAGETKGEAFNNVWFVAKPDYSIMLVNAQLTGNDGKVYRSDYTEGAGKTLYFSDSYGITLYGFSIDSFNVNKFTQADFSNNAVWPIYETDQVIVPSVVDKALFTAISVFGRKQLTYKGWPLYYFGADNMQRGSNKGVSVPAPGVWPVMVKEIPEAPRP